MAETGNLTDKPVARIFREMMAARRNGILRLTQGKQIKAVFFEEGQAVFGISNVPEDQLDVMLVRRRKLTRDQAVEAKSQIKKEHEFGRKLLELNYISQAGLQ